MIKRVSCGLIIGMKKGKVLWKNFFLFLITILFSAIIVKTVYGEQIIRMEEMVVKGRVQKPQAMYILQRSAHVTFETSIKNKREDFRLYILNEIRQNRELFAPKLENKTNE